MATTLAALALIATTLAGITLLCWGSVHYTTGILNGTGHAEESHPDDGRPS